ncbi:hypothetical protein [Campylobacter sp. 19-13652]|uniref:hypothetical protein n=1 Tax=Campylobacter sp. 19-13652 TaxID=2840180 RepID=UPI001C85D83A|nr:hypothetical protein [Campylobacter sp. 19-13652]
MKERERLCKARRSSSFYENKRSAVIQAPFPLAQRRKAVTLSKPSLCVKKCVWASVGETAASWRVVSSKLL